MRPVSILSNPLNHIAFVSKSGDRQPNFLLATARFGYNSHTTRPSAPDSETSSSTSTSLRKQIMDPQRPDSLESHSEDDNLQDSSQSAADSKSAASVETHEERLARIKSEIESGSYETPEKLELAIERMLGVLSE